MKYSLFFLMITSMFISMSNPALGARTDVVEEDKIQDLESKVSSRLNRNFQVFYGENPGFIAQVKLELFDYNKSIKSNEKPSNFDYLPLKISGKTLGGDSLLTIRSYEVKIISDKELSSAEQTKIKGIVNIELGEKTHMTTFHVFSSGGILSSFFKSLGEIGKSSLFWGLVLLMTSFSLIFLGFTHFKNTQYKLKSDSNNIYHSNIYELVHFIREQVKINKEILNQVLTNSNDDILGMKALLTYLSAQYQPHAILFASTMVAIENEDNSYDEYEFSSWLRKFSERISSYNLRTGNQFKLFGTDKELVKQIRSVPEQALNKVLKKLNSNKTYAAVFKVVDGKAVKGILGDYDPKLWKEIESVDEKSLNIDKELKTVLEELKNFKASKKKAKKKKKANTVSEQEDSLKKSEDMTEELSLVDNSDYDSQEFSWHKDNFDQLPSLYLQQKLAGKNFLEISMIMLELKGNVKYHFLKQLNNKLADQVIAHMEKVGNDERDSSHLEKFLIEVQKDYDQGVFTIKHSKAA